MFCAAKLTCLLANMEHISFRIPHSAFRILAIVNFDLSISAQIANYEKIARFFGKITFDLCGTTENVIKLQQIFSILQLTI